MSDEEDTTILLNTENKNPEVDMKKLDNDYQCIPGKNLRKPLSRQQDNLTPLTSGNKSILVSAVAILAGIAFGCDMGIVEPISISIRYTFTLTCFEKDLIARIWFFAAIFAGLTGGTLIDAFGRRWTMILSLVFLTFGAMLSALADHYIILLIARGICGYSGTLSAIAHCIYMAEVSDSNKRGYNIMLYQLGIVLGLIISIMTTFLKNIDYKWQLSIGITSIFSLTSCIIVIIFLQRSPSFLLLKKTYLDLSKTKFKDSHNIVLETLIMMTIMLILQQGTGRLQVLYYAPRLFALLGFCSNVAEITALISLGIVRVFSTILSLIIVERCGRRTALITSATICMTTISLLSLLATIDRGDDSLNIDNVSCRSNSAGSLVLNGQSSDSQLQFPLLPTPLAITAPNSNTWTNMKISCENQEVVLSEGLTGGLRILAVITSLVYEAAFALGLGPVPLLNLCEIFPAAIRGRCVGFVIALMWISHLVISGSVNRMTKIFTLAGSFLIYSFICLMTIFYVFLVIPETKGKSLHQVIHELRKVSLINRTCNNLRSLPLFCYAKWMKKYKNDANVGQSTLI